MRIVLGKYIFIFMMGYSMLCATSFTMTLDNHTPIVGEKILLTLTFSYEDVEDYEMQEPQNAPSFEHFKIKTLEDIEYQESNGTWIAKITYELKAQKAGVFTLAPLQTHIETIELKYQKLYNKNKYLVKTNLQAKPLTLNVTPLPQGLKVTGTYTLTTEVDKQKVKAGEPVHFTLHLKGEGNIADLSFFTLAIPHTTVYETSSSTNKKEFDIVSDHNYTIPVLSLQYYNQSTQSTELLSSPAFSIEVITAPTVQKSKTKVLLFLSLIFAGLLYYLYRLFNSLAHLDKKATFIKVLKKCKTKEELLAKVAPYLGKDRGLDRLIFRLEEVENDGFIALKKDIAKIFKFSMYFN